MIHIAIQESFSDRSKNPQVGIEHRSAEKASLSCVGTCQRSHWSRLKERDPHKTKADKPFRLLLCQIRHEVVPARMESRIRVMEFLFFLFFFLFPPLFRLSPPIFGGGQQTADSSQNVDESKVGRISIYSLSLSLERIWES